jgi:polar amino acid transport system substrate-binding protein
MKKIFGTLALLLLAGVILVWYHSTSDLKPLGKILIVGTSADFPPFSFRTPSDEIVGFDIDVVKEVARRLSLDVDLQDKPFGTLIPQIELGQIHAIAAGMTPTVDRAKRVLVVTKSSLPSITSIEDLKGKQVIVNTGYTADTYMSSLPDIELLRLPKVTDALTALDYGKADAFVTAAFSIEPYVKEDDTRFSTFKIPETNEENALALSKNLSQEFVQNVQKALDDMEADGTLGALKKKWNVI